MIIGVTDELQVATFPEIGQLRKGAPKPERGPGRDLKYFRFTSKLPDVAAAFMRAYGAEPRVIDRVFFPYAGILENFDAWAEAWRAGSLDHRCNGQICVLWQERGRFWTPESYAAAHGLDAPYVKACPGGCKWTGRLKVILGHRDFAPVGGFSQITVLTTAKNDVINIYRQLKAITVLRGIEDLRGIPCALSRVPHMISTPPRQPGGERQRIEKWLIHVEMEPEFAGRALIAAQERADPLRLLPPPPTATLALPAAGELEDEDETDPDEAAAAREQAAAPTNLDTLRARLTALWDKEVAAGKQNPPSERAIDLGSLSYTALVQLGIRVATRVKLLDGGDTAAWAKAWDADNRLAAPAVEGDVSAVASPEAAAAQAAN